MDVNEMTRKQFEELPFRNGLFSDHIGNFDSIIILPGRAKDKHDSGYRCMDFVAVKDNKPMCKLSGCSDVVHVDGIGGYGYDWLNKYKTVPKTLPVKSWNIDCLPKSGLLRMWCTDYKLCVGAALSSFELFAEKPTQ
ncbi:unnamed protein product [marine sediment metagenome]|uniref:Uncharacterized protein n=1 Tax=marine sediment metagenome TaxID=412755 RepID=X0XHN4_9ZZZZ